LTFSGPRRPSSEGWRASRTCPGLALQAVLGLLNQSDIWLMACWRRCTP
jgi:hypothetical protein